MHHECKIEINWRSAVLQHKDERHSSLKVFPLGQGQARSPRFSN
jgi:hypothetical protein